MADPDADSAVTKEKLTSRIDAPDEGSSFAEQSYLTYVIPSQTEINLEDAFQNVNTGTSVFDLIEQRDSLFFDETVTVLLILKTPEAEESNLSSHIGRLSLSLEAQIVNSGVASREEASTGADTIFSGSPADVSSPYVIKTSGDEEEEEDAASHIYCVWKVPVFLARPRIRLQGPSIVFTASASLRPDVSAELNSGRDGYLQSGMPSGYNLLGSFSQDPALNGVQPRLSALRVSRVAPVTKQQELIQHIRSLQQLTLRIHPVIHTRIRFSRPATVLSSAAVIAMLEVDFTSHFDCEVLLNDITLSMDDGEITDMNTGADLALPLSCVSYDHITFLYHIAPKGGEVTPKTAVRELKISIAARAEVDPGVCMPPLAMSWSTNLDFTTPVNPGFGSSSTAGIQRSHRPSQLSIGGQAIVPLKSPGTVRPDALPALEAATSRTDTAIQDLGITMSFRGPAEPVLPGEIFSWAVHIVNRATEKTTAAPRKLALVAIPKRTRAEIRPVRAPSTATRRAGEQEVADAVQDESVLHAFQKNAAVDSADVICLSADTRVGPLAPGTCHLVELQFLALLEEGIIGIEAVRVVDLGSQEHVDIRDLPTTIVKPLAPEIQS